MQRARAPVEQPAAAQVLAQGGLDSAGSSSGGSRQTPPPVQLWTRATAAAVLEAAWLCIVAVAGWKTTALAVRCPCPPFMAWCAGLPTLTERCQIAVRQQRLGGADGRAACCAWRGRAERSLPGGGWGQCCLCGRLGKRCWADGCRCLLRVRARAVREVAPLRPRTALPGTAMEPCNSLPVGKTGNRTDRIKSVSVGRAVATLMYWVS
jgi:hypothetical protein